jgi:hypothetical protein
MWRRLVNIALSFFLGILLASFVAIWLRRGIPATGFVGNVFWAGVISIPIFLLVTVRIFDWSFTQRAASRRKAANPETR